MPNANPSHLDLQAIARQVMQQRGFQPDFPSEVPKQLADLKAHPPQVAAARDVRDLRKCDVEYFRNMRSYKIIEVEARCRLSLGRITARFLMMGKGVINHDPVFIEFHLQFLGA